MSIMFLDTEFTGLNKDAQLISIALYYTEECFFYAELNDVNYEQTSSWIKENVIMHMEYKNESVVYTESSNYVKMKGSPLEVVGKLSKWIEQFEHIEIWADVLAYDWILFCNLFGGALQIPKNIFYIPFDLSTLLKLRLENPDIDRFRFVSHLLTEDDKKMKHHALMDAKVGKLCYGLIV